MPDKITDTDRPSACQGCMDEGSPIYRLELKLSGKGWSTTKRVIWLCAICQHVLAFETDFLSGYE